MAASSDPNARATARTRLPSGETMLQRAKRVGGALGTTPFGQRRRVPNGPWTVERTIPEDDLVDLKQSGYIDRWAGNGHAVDILGGLDNRVSGVRDFVEIWDDETALHDEYVYGMDQNGNPYGETYDNKAVTAIDPDTGMPMSPTSWSATVASPYDTTPAPISVVPTTTTNWQRPRTVAAGYAIEPGQTAGKITVVFRDGTVYNYYDVTLTEWGQFKARQSKGKYIRSYLDSKPRGVADRSDYTPEVRATLYRIAAQKQTMARGRKIDKKRRGNRPKTVGETKTMPSRPKRR